MKCKICLSNREAIKKKVIVHTIRPPKMGMFANYHKKFKVSVENIGMCSNCAYELKQSINRWYWFR